jgi:hypothetical protein
MQMLQLLLAADRDGAAAAQAAGHFHLKGAGVA